MKIQRDTGRVQSFFLLLGQQVERTGTSESLPSRFRVASETPAGNFRVASETPALARTRLGPAGPGPSLRSPKASDGRRRPAHGLVARRTCRVDGQAWT